jgi:predicted pyridoxine 5'-phosphate oxidase superfamily flavin-nucleotide-binding protein
MTSLYSREHHALQERFGTEKLADMLDTNWVHAALSDEESAFIESRDMLFLSTVDPDGNPTVSYKGGPTGFVKVLDPSTVAFPGYDGNGMFLSMGNIGGQGKVGLLFIDFETPNRLRLQGDARVVFDDPLMAAYAEAQYIVRVEITKAWINCPRYIHRYTKGDQSRYVPRADRETPLASWKRLEMVRDVLTPADRTRAKAEGLMPIEEYQARVARGES